MTLPTLSSLASLLNPLTGPRDQFADLTAGPIGDNERGERGDGASTGLSALASNPAALGPLLSATALSAVASAPVALGNTVTTIANTVSRCGVGHLRPCSIRRQTFSLPP